MCESFAEITAELKLRIKEDESLLLPMSAILETGNHIGQNGNGRQRRQAAKRFVDLIQQAIRGETPFEATTFFGQEALLEWLGEFPDWASRGSGLADLTIVKEFERQCSLNPMRRVYIWSNDQHLSSYDRRP